MSDVTCKHHPEYDPASGEPTNPLSAMVNYGSVKDIPCPYCWQVRAQWLEDQCKDLTQAILDDPLQERIEELEAERAEMQEARKEKA